MTKMTDLTISKVARFRELMNAKKIQEEAETPHSSASNPISSLRVATTSGQSSSTTGAKTWPLPPHSLTSFNETKQQRSRGVPLNLNDELEQEHQSKVITSTDTSAKDYHHPNNLAAMTEIMRRKQMMKHATRKDQDDSLVVKNTTTPAFDEKEESSSSSWAMLGCHMDETTLDSEGASELLQMNSLAISPFQWKQMNNDPISQSLSGNCMGSDGDGDGASGNSGVLTFLGESPLFDQTMISSDDDEVLSRSAEKVKRLEEHLLRSAGEGMLSPVNPPPSSGQNNWSDSISKNESARNSGRAKEVTFAVQDGLQTPKGESHLTYPKSPYYFNDSSDDINMSMQVQANPMNESAIISDDEASEQGFGSTSPMEGVGSDADENSSDSLGCGMEFTSNESNEIEVLGFELSSKCVSGKSRHKDATPTRASLMERNHTLVKEVRFADQTCVALSERKKYYKNQVGQYKETIKAANKENSSLRRDLEISLQESAKLKVLVEALQTQKHQADLQVEAYQAQIIDTVQMHRSSFEKLEKSHTSHLKSAKDQINSLNEELSRSNTTNSKLQFMLERVNNKLESKLQNDAASKELITSLKERVASGDSAVLNANCALEALRNRISELEKLCEQQKDQLQQERADREITEKKSEDLQRQYNDLHFQLTEWPQTSDSLEKVLFNDGDENFIGDLNELTPLKRLDGDAQLRTPTSNLLARTLRSELKRRQHVTDKLENAEHQVTVLKDRIFDIKMDHEEAKADNALLEEELQEKKNQIANLETALAEKDNQVDLLCEEIEDLRRDHALAVLDAESKSESSSEINRDSTSVLEERLDAIEETLEFTDEELIETKARLADTQELLEQTASELERSEEELAIECRKVSDYEMQVDNLMKELTEKEVEHANITKFSDFQSSTIETMKDRLSLSEKVNVELRAQIKSCFQSLTSLEKILRTYEDLEGVAGKIMSEQRRKIARLLETMEKAPQDRSGSMELKDVDSESNSESPADSNERHLVTTVCEKCINSQELIRIERDEANDQLQKANKLIQEFRDEVSNQDKRYTDQIISLKNQCTELEKNLLAVTAELKSCKTENETLSATVALTENATSQQMSVIRKNNSDLIKENEGLRISLQSVELQLESEQALKQAAQETADSYRLDASNAKAAFECLSTERDLTKASLCKVEKQKQELQELVNQKDKDMKTNKERHTTTQASLQQQIESLKAQCTSLKAELSVEKDNKHAVEGMLNEASKRSTELETTIKSMKIEFEEKQNQCQELIVQVKQIQSALDEAERERADADGTISRLEIDIQDKKSIIFAYEESIITYKSDIRRLDNELQTIVQNKNNRIQMLEQACSSRQALFTEQLERTKKERDASTSECTEMITRLQNELEDSNRSRNESEERAKVTIIKLNEVQRACEEEIICKQSLLDEETKKYCETCQQLENAKNEILVLTNRLNSNEMDCNRLATKHQDEIDELLKNKNILASQKNQLEEHVHRLQISLGQIEEVRIQQDNEIAQLSAHNASLEKKCNTFKDTVKSLNEVNRAWEDSYNAQSEDLVTHGMEISRLQAQVSDLKRAIISSQQSSNRL